MSMIIADALRNNAHPAQILLAFAVCASAASASATTALDAPLHETADRSAQSLALSHRSSELVVDHRDGIGAITDHEITPDATKEYSQKAVSSRTKKMKPSLLTKALSMVDITPCPSNVKDKNRRCGRLKKRCQNPKMRRFMDRFCPATCKCGAPKCKCGRANMGCKCESLAKPSKPFDWSQCKSEGGSKDCAVCDTSPPRGNNVLPCSKVVKGRGKLLDAGIQGGKITDCRDDDILRKRKVWIPLMGFGSCVDLGHISSLKGIARTAYGLEGTDVGKDSLVLTKIWVTHPNMAEEEVGVVMFKRIVMHKCTGRNKPSACIKGTTVADVHKDGYCIQCDEAIFRRYAEATTDDMSRKFVNECLPKAVDPTTGELKANFKCGRGTATTRRRRFNARERRATTRGRRRSGINNLQRAEQALISF